MPFNVGLTGASGVLGRRLTAAFTQADVKFDVFSGDIRDQGDLMEWMQGAFECVVHAAAVVPVAHVASRPGDAIAVNVAGTANVASVTQSAGKRLMYVSTSHVYAPSATPLPEVGTLLPSSLYGLTKLQGEAWVQRLAPRSQIVRIFSFFDNKQPESYVVPALFARVRAAKPEEKLLLDGYHDVRDIASAQWHAEVILKLLARDDAGPVNCGTGRGVSIAQLAREIAVAAGRQDVTFEPSDASSVLSSTIVADTTRLRELVGDVAESSISIELDAYARGC